MLEQRAMIRARTKTSTIAILINIGIIVKLCIVIAIRVTGTVLVSGRILVLVNPAAFVVDISIATRKVVAVNIVRNMVKSMTLMALMMTSPAAMLTTAVVIAYGMAMALTRMLITVMATMALAMLVCTNVVICGASAIRYTSVRRIVPLDSF